ncbi:hypothetical protein VFPPC_17359 [Pochonia chlamydosporia 170]|uniref:Uncharacterized protein n=1 Tax=Pochonia chlamydosporia 170 TaxID=1380566 RepID=A0A219AS74_METCM|nr:hypothetical protein VFPPC_17359 [Pochonia chlamydosporia 170]OWT43492.1 hypothetical protein VFPPC_17359 [Pochonia chlamydosporia 170]
MAGLHRRWDHDQTFRLSYGSSAIANPAHLPKSCSFGSGSARISILVSSSADYHPASSSRTSHRWSLCYGVRGLYFHSDLVRRESLVLNTENSSSYVTVSISYGSCQMPGKPCSGTVSVLAKMDVGFDSIFPTAPERYQSLRL